MAIIGRYFGGLSVDDDVYSCLFQILVVAILEIHSVERKKYLNHNSLRIMLFEVCLLLGRQKRNECAWSTYIHLSDRS